MRVYTLSDMQSEKKLRVYTASEAKGLMGLRFEPRRFFLNGKILLYKALPLLWLQG